MRAELTLLALAACGSSSSGDLPDAATPIDAALDAPIDAPTCPKVLLTGGSDPTTQGWTVVQQPPATLTVNPDDLQLQTSTAAQANTSGQLLLVRAGVLQAGQPFTLRVVLRVDQVNNHNQLDAGAAIMGSFTPSFGNQTDRGEMIYLDSNALGWADDTGHLTTPITNGAFHTYDLAVDAAGAATVTIDGSPALTRTGFAFNGTIAIGDQTNDRNVDATIHLRSVALLCP